MAPKVGEFLDREHVQEGKPEIQIIRHRELKNIRTWRIVLYVCFLVAPIFFYSKSTPDGGVFEVFLAIGLLYGLAMLWVVILWCKIRWAFDMQDRVVDFLGLEGHYTETYVSYVRAYE